MVRCSQYDTMVSIFAPFQLSYVIKHRSTLVNDLVIRMHTLSFLNLTASLLDNFQFALFQPNDIGYHWSLHETIADNIVHTLCHNQRLSHTPLCTILHRMLSRVLPSHSHLRFSSNNHVDVFVH